MIRERRSASPFRYNPPSTADDDTDNKKGDSGHNYHGMHSDEFNMPYRDYHPDGKFKG